MKTLIVVALFCLALTGCALLSDSPQEGRIAVQYATLKAVNGDPERASRVRAWVRDARSYMDATEGATLEGLESLIRERIQWRRYDTADQLIIDQMLIHVRLWIEENTANRLIKGTTRQTVGDVLGWAEDALRGV